MRSPPTSTTGRTTTRVTPPTGPARRLVPSSPALACVPHHAGYGMSMDGRTELDWRKTVFVGIAINAANGALTGWAAAATRREERERTRIRWTDANRWE